MKRSGMITFILVAILYLAPTASALPPVHLGLQPDTYFPDTEWATASPESQNMSGQVLDDLVDWVDASVSPIHSLLVIRNGYLVAEEYWRGYNENSSHHIFSCTKSFTSALVGIAIREGFIEGVDQHMLDFFPEITPENPSALKDSITIEHLLTMTHGLDWNEWNNSYSDPTNMYNQMFFSADSVKFFLDLPAKYTPGTVWVYTTGASHVLSAIVQRATNMTARAFAEQYLFEPMNATISAWSVVDGVNNGGTQLYITPRTMAKLGLLYLNNGTWDGQEILTEDWVLASQASHIGISYGESYGYQWWVYDAYPGFMAIGSEMQVIYVCPEYDLVVVVTGAVLSSSQDISWDIISSVRRAVTEFDPALNGLDALSILVLTAGTASVAVLIMFVVWRRRGHLAE